MISFRDDLSNSYTLLDEYDVLAPKTITNIGYADGGEAKLLEIIGKCEDRSTFSSEFLPFMKNWPIEYHFSRKRHLILRPFNIKPGDRVLELGAGCGAISRYLGEAGADVLAVEGELSRAIIGSQRCKDLPNVQFMSEDFLNLDLDMKFDWILMVGVFEYSQKYGSDTDRQGQYLNIVKKHLAPEGSLILAIENKIGLKYFNGAGEDHNGHLYYGVQDLYTGNDITTWGKAELTSILLNNGLNIQNLYGVFPDYKLPKIIFHSDAAKYDEFRAEELLLYSKSIDYRGKNSRAYDEALALGVLRKNGIMLDFSNSFLIQACDVNHDGQQAGRQIAHYFSINRKIEFCTLTTFSSDSLNKISLKKELVLPDEGQTQRLIFVTDHHGKLYQINHAIDDASDYLRGELLGMSIAKAMRSGNQNNFAIGLSRWIKFLAENFVLFRRESDHLLSASEISGLSIDQVSISGSSLDCGPQNIIFSDAGEEAFDLEWTSDENVPLNWVLYRNLKHALRISHIQTVNFQLEPTLQFVAEQFGLALSTTALEEAIELERQFQVQIAHVEPSNLVSLTVSD